MEMVSPITIDSKHHAETSHFVFPYKIKNTPQTVQTITFQKEITSEHFHKIFKQGV